jgi:ABC-type sugar transport system ATPase subunit
MQFPCSGCGNGSWNLFANPELQEIFNLADRILVMHDGKITADLSIGEANQEVVMRAAIGAV